MYAVFALLLFSLHKSSRRRSHTSSICPDAEKLYDHSYFNNSNFPINFSNFSFSEDQSFAGKGHFSVVKKSTLSDGRVVAVKEIKIFKRRDLIRELSVLKAIEKVNHTIKLIGVTGNETNPIILYSFHNSTKYGYQNLTMSQFKWWLKTLLETVSELHEHGIIHRDLKLGNILADFDNKELTIIDFGLAEFNRLRGPKRPRVGCFRLKSPELAIESEKYDCSSDIWAIGIACLDLMIGFRSNWIIKSNSMLVQNLISYFGSKTWNNFVKKYDKSYLAQYSSHGDIFELAMPGHYKLVTLESLDLVYKFLTFDPKQRITARQALKHPFFTNE
ncbi:Casein kinase II subunit alpha' [Tritrichomonas foetus]|uniref:non-specific serine/threonine protein kinase n=1 Tax=Tritrichomonas foetus TaxID=1144522 RepID=A0A1J4J8C9_9EUKA|nr:Casein kinase II subunit alpha' [Tritrichomonas foetus]|eukprot:OHS93947.1 Casein kinase II subunit alpha' [Tritrichomonas foetus]